VVPTALVRGSTVLVAGTPQEHSDAAAILSGCLPLGDDDLAAFIATTDALERRVVLERVSAG
jgi:hypothetical protein